MMTLDDYREARRTHLRKSKNEVFAVWALSPVFGLVLGLMVWAAVTDKLGVLRWSGELGLVLLIALTIGLPFVGGCYVLTVRRRKRVTELGLHCPNCGGCLEAGVSATVIEKTGTCMKCDALLSLKDNPTILPINAAPNIIIGSSIIGK